MIKIARMQNGEDVVADVKEIRANESDTRALAYEFDNAFTVTLLQSSSNMFDDVQSDQYQDEEPPDPLDQLSDLRLQFFPWSPLSTGRNVVTLFSVVSMSDPHQNVLEGYHNALEKLKSLKENNAEGITTEDSPRDVYFAEDNGDG